MSIYEVIAIFISAVGIVISIISLIKVHKADKISQGQIELNIHQLISGTKKDVLDLTLMVTEKLSSDQEKTKEILNQALESAKEQNLNAYEEACAKYLDNKVDKERFKKNYIIEIRQLVERNSDKYNTTSPYKATLKVYNEWNNLEGK